MSVAVTRLPSGLTVATDRMAHVETASLGVWINAGSRNEAKREHGLSHLLEHMAFKGTATRSAKAIAEAIEAAGGDLNAATGPEQTAYNTQILAADAPMALDLIADILTNSVFDADELEREKDVILQEIAGVEDMPEDVVHEMFTATAFPDQALGRPILGTAKTVKGFDGAAIRAYLARCYRAGATIVAAAGDVDHEAIVAAAGRLFAGLPQGEAAPVETPRYVGGEALAKRRLEQAHLLIGFEGRSFQAEDSLAAYFFASAVGGGMSSRLFQEVRERRGLAYSVHASHWTYADTGLFSVYAGAGGSKIGEVADVALECLATATRDLTEAELQRAKAQTKVSRLAALESTQARAEQMARQLFVFGRVLPTEEIVSRIDAVTLEATRATGARLLSGAPTVAAVGPLRKAPTAALVRARLGSV